MNCAFQARYFTFKVTYQAVQALATTAHFY